MKNKKIDNKNYSFFCLEELENFDNKEGFLILDSSYFKIVKILIDTTLDERERNIVVEEELNAEIENYTKDSFVEKELILNEENNIQTIIVICLDKIELQGIFSILKDKKISLLGIYPKFFLEKFSKEIDKTYNYIEEIDKTYNYIELIDNKVFVFKYHNGKLIDYIQFNEDLDTIMLESDFLQENSFVTYSEKDCSLMNTLIENIELKNWKEYSLEYKDELNFLPNEVKNVIGIKNIVKKLILVFLVFLIVALVIYLILNRIEEDYRMQIVTYQREVSSFKNQIKNIEEQTLNYKEKIDRLNEEKVEEKSLKQSILLEKILNNRKNLTIKEIKFNGKNKIDVIGFGDSEIEVLNFKENNLKIEEIKNFNQDYIKKNEKNIEFSLEFELKKENENEEGFDE